MDYAKDDVINLKIYLQSSSKAMVERLKRWEDKNTKIWVSWKWRELFRRKALHRWLRDIVNSLKIIKGSLEWLKNKDIAAVLDKKLSQALEMLR